MGSMFFYVMDEESSHGNPPRIAMVRYDSFSSQPSWVVVTSLGKQGLA